MIVKLLLNEFYKTGLVYQVNSFLSTKRVTYWWCDISEYQGISPNMRYNRCGSMTLEVESNITPLEYHLFYNFATTGVGAVKKKTIVVILI